jgi:hypothetical protein
MIVAMVSALALSAPAYAGCDGLDGKDLKKCEKAAAKQAKKDASTEPLLPSQVDSRLAAWDASNPFATDEYRVRWGATGIQEVDDYLIKAAKIKGTVVAARYIVDQAKADPASVTEVMPVLTDLMTGVPDQGKSLIDDGKALVGKLPTILAGPDALKIPKITTSLTDAIGNITSTLAELPKVAEALAGAK